MFEIATVHRTIALQAKRNVHLLCLHASGEKACPSATDNTENSLDNLRVLDFTNHHRNSSCNVPGRANIKKKGNHDSQAPC